MSQFLNLIDLITEQVQYGYRTLFDHRLYIDCWFAPQKPFKITEDMLLDKDREVPFKYENTWSGQVVKIISDDELILKIVGSYSEMMIPTFDKKVPFAMKGFDRFRGFPFTIKYRLTPGDNYFISDKVEPTGKWLQVTFTKND